MHGHPREKDWELICAGNWEPYVFPGRTSSWEQVYIVAEAISAMRQRHADFDVFNSLLLTVAGGFLPNLSVSTPIEFLEAVYCYGKFSDLCAPLREKSVLEAAPVISTRTM